MNRTSTKGRAVARSTKIHPAAAVLFAAAALLTMAVSAAHALPTADEVLEASIEAMGGRKAFEAIENRVTEGTMSIPAMGITGKMISYSAPPNLQYSIVETEGMGSMESGTNGEVVWEKTAMTGPRVKTGAERAAALREAIFNSVLEWKKLYAKTEVVGEEEVDGTMCYKLIMTPPEGEGGPETHYYDQESHLLTKIVLILNTEMGDVPIESFISDYREVDGLKVAFKTRQVVMNMQEMHFTLDSVKHNVELPKDRFALPEDIQALVGD